MDILKRRAINRDVPRSDEAINRSVPRVGGVGESKLLFLGGLAGLTPGFRIGGSGQPLAEAAEVLREGPDSAVGAEHIEPETPAPEDR